MVVVVVVVVVAYFFILFVCAIGGWLLGCVVREACMRFVRLVRLRLRLCVWGRKRRRVFACVVDVDVAPKHAYLLAVGPPVGRAGACAYATAPRGRLPPRPRMYVLMD